MTWLRTSIFKTKQGTTRNLSEQIDVGKESLQVKGNRPLSLSLHSLSQLGRGLADLCPAVALPQLGNL